MSESESSTNVSLLRSPELIGRHGSQLLIVDVQEKLLPAIVAAERLVPNIIFLLQAAKILKVPVCISEQYPKGLGTTVSEITDEAGDVPRFEKLRFSAAQAFLESRASDDAVKRPEQVVITGMESHVCVLQTALDLLSLGSRVFVVKDAVGSRDPADKAVAMRRLRDAGAVVVTAESVVFEWSETAGTDEFRHISRLVRDRDSSQQ